MSMPSAKSSIGISNARLRSGAGAVLELESPGAGAVLELESPVSSASAGSEAGRFREGITSCVRSGCHRVGSQRFSTRGRNFRRTR